MRDSKRLIAGRKPQQLCIFHPHATTFLPGPFGYPSVNIPKKRRVAEHKNIFAQSMYPSSTLWEQEVDEDAKGWLHQNPSVEEGRLAEHRDMLAQSRYPSSAPWGQEIEERHRRWFHRHLTSHSWLHSSLLLSSLPLPPPSLPPFLHRRRTLN
jgi:hypothetical protein